MQTSLWPEPLLRHLAPADRDLVQRFGTGPSVDVPYGLVHRAFEAHAATASDAVAAIDLGAGDTISYGELDRQANALAHRLVAAGVRPGDNVALFVRRSIPMIVGLLGTLKAGAAYVPQDVGITPLPQLAHVVATARTRVILTTSAYVDRVPDGPLVVALDSPMGSAATPPVVASSPGDGCYVLFTSGTTGKPNGVKVTHRNVANILLTAPGSLGIRPGWRVAQLLNVAFDMAAWEILGCLSHGATLVIRGSDISEAARLADVLIATPTVLSVVDPAECPQVRVVAVAGEPCPRPLADRWASRCDFFNSCGPTETTIVNTMQRHDPSAIRLSIGRPTPNNTVYVLDDDRRLCAFGEVGEMWAGGDCVSAGYLDNPALNVERYAPDPFLGGGRLMFRTRDLGRWTPDGELEHLGRTDDQVKVRGFRVELDSVSAVLEGVPGCGRAVTLKLDDRNLVSFVTPASVDVEAARSAVASALPYYCVPSSVYAVASLPETSRGKVDKQALVALAEAAPMAARVAS